MLPHKGGPSLLSRQFPRQVNCFSTEHRSTCFTVHNNECTVQAVCFFFSLPLFPFFVTWHLNKRQLRVLRLEKPFSRVYAASKGTRSKRITAGFDYKLESLRCCGVFGTIQFFISLSLSSREVNMLLRIGSCSGVHVRICIGRACMGESIAYFWGCLAGLQLSLGWGWCWTVGLESTGSLPDITHQFVGSPKAEPANYHGRPLTWIIHD